MIAVFVDVVPNAGIFHPVMYTSSGTDVKWNIEMTQIPCAYNAIRGMWLISYANFFM